MGFSLECVTASKNMDDGFHNKLKENRHHYLYTVSMIEGNAIVVYSI
jgi:hypothetical protein